MVTGKAGTAVKVTHDARPRKDAKKLKISQHDLDPSRRSSTPQGAASSTSA